MIQDFDFQTEAIHELCDKTNRLLVLEGSETIIFKAPTGSGKTVTMGQYLKQLVENRSDSRTFAFIWAAPRQLHNQSREKLEALYADSKALRCVSVEDLIDRKINEREILFLNWESINKADNIYIRENERDMNLSAIMQNTRDAGTTVLLVIDESHFASKTETSRDLISMFNPKVTIEVSATPTMMGDEMVTVPRQKVIEEGMIKKQIVINPGFKNEITRQSSESLSFTSKGEESTDEFVLRMALDKRAELAKGFQAAGTNVNPLLIIQLPDRRQGEADVREEIEKLLEKKHDITVKNGKLAIYLSEDKANLENITRNDSEVEVMIFKQAIALGWDCPRASILALFRDWHSFTFSTQTVGRILRMPELKHYTNEDLNIGFVFTSLEDLTIIEDLAGTYLTIQYATRSKGYEPIHLRSFYPRRHREETRLSPQFIRDFLKATEEMDLKSRVHIDIGEVETTLLTDAAISDLDKHPEHISKDSGTIERRQTEMEVQKSFDAFARESLSPEFFPEKRSVGRVKEAIYYFFKMKFPASFKSATTRAQIIALHPSNSHYFVNALNRAKEIYRANVERENRELITVEDWEIPESITRNNRFTEVKAAKSVMQPYLEGKDAREPEREFAKFLGAKLEGVEWFFKNGESDSTSFAVRYKDGAGEERLFYVDWVVKFKDGRVGLFDTKAGITAETAKYRSEGLAGYIKEENRKGKNLFGGIVISKGGSWRYNNSPKYEYNPDDLSGWKVLS